MAKKNLIPAERIHSSILLIRGQKVILDRDLATLYGIETRALKQAVRRNIDRFPEDFMFVLNDEEFRDLRSQTVTSSSWGGTRYPPMAFTEQGVAMLSSVLKSPRAIEVNIAIMRTFVKLRRILQSHAELDRKLVAMEKKYDGQFRSVFEAIRQLMKPPAADSKQIGFEAKEAQENCGTKTRKKRK